MIVSKNHKRLNDFREPNMKLSGQHRGKSRLFLTK